jgi:hypothetical protein
MSEEQKIEMPEIVVKIVEKKIEEEKEDIVVTFVQLFENFLKEDLSKFNVKLTPEIQQYFLLICKQKPDLFGDFEKSLKQIILDNKIDTKDIPEILVLVNKIHTILKEDKSLHIIDHYEVIKILLHLYKIIKP